ncbi:hypothetical protein HGO23_06485 [Xenorhabdus budapestensis]|uniref:Transcriptional regulator n=1 Tax=Xenorhabdus budapestensis TaxID=290110 RepID=A0ABX7VKK6_XENBU|nr:hypothetical protein [Xenorhabdus budapestensis]QTL40945.1 hypothetical protein HGO23_06280 [Xenorhabdus budapestensis]QTL40982.1 hypothetical protein HGO23_06485 [Xenorhabdus budapestensis]
MKIKLPTSDKCRLKNAININAEMNVLLISSLKELEEEFESKQEVEPDYYYMLRAVKRLSVCQFEDLTKLNEIFE